MNIQAPHHLHSHIPVPPPSQAESYAMYYPYGRQPIMQANTLNGFYGPMIQLNQMMYPMNQTSAYIPIPSSKPVQMQIQIMTPSSTQVAKSQMAHRQSIRRCNMSESRAWTQEEDAIIMNKYRTLGARYEMIANSLQNRSTNAVHNRLIELQRNYPMPTITTAPNNMNCNVIQQSQMLNVKHPQQQQVITIQQVVPQSKVIEVSKPASFINYIPSNGKDKKEKKTRFDDFEFAKADTEPRVTKNICLSLNPDLEGMSNYV